MSAEKPRNPYSRAIALQADGRIVVAGCSPTFFGDEFTVARYFSSGSLDTTFGGIGWVRTDFDGSDDCGYAVAIQADAKIVQVRGYYVSGE